MYVNTNLYASGGSFIANALCMGYERQEWQLWLDVNLDTFQE